MRQVLDELEQAMRIVRKPSPWSAEHKASDDVLSPLFQSFSERLGVPLVLRKTEYSRLARYMTRDMVEPEIGEKLAAIVEVAARARGGQDLQA